MAVSAPHYRFTVDEFYRMSDAGIFDEDDRVELIEGEIIEMSPIGGPHLNCVNALTEILVLAVTGTAKVSVQNPVRLSDYSIPQPDFAVIRFIEHEKVPAVSDVFLVIEVSDTTLAYDRRVKLPLYAQAGIPEAWLVDVVSRTVTRHTEPQDGRYRVSRRHALGTRLETDVVPSARIVVEVDTLFR